MNGAVGELIFHNRYSYAGSNPVNRVDPSGKCWSNCDSTETQKAECLTAWLDYEELVAEVYGDWWRDNLNLREMMYQENLYWSNLSYSDFVSQWNDNSARPPSSMTPNYAGDIAGGSASIAGTMSLVNPLLGPEDAGAIIILAGGLCLAGFALIANALGAGKITLPNRLLYGFGAETYAFRLPGLDSRVETLAEHLAKLLGRDVAGKPPDPEPNPNQYPNRSWCLTIKKIIKAIDDADYTPRQFNRDLEATGYGGSKWTEIVDAVKEVVDKGLCDDHWGNFNGGSLATS